jgi:hypothetical protein
MHKEGGFMKGYRSLMAITLFCGVAFAQTQPPSPQTAIAATPIAESLRWVIGTWEGEGVSPGEREFIGRMQATVELDDQGILLRRESLNKSGGPTGGLKELMVIAIDGTTKKIVMTVNSSNNFIGIYTGETRSPNEIVFTLVTSQAGYVNRRVFKQLADGGVSFVIEGASPGKEVSKQVEINFKKKS